MNHADVAQAAADLHMDPYDVAVEVELTRRHRADGIMIFRTGGRGFGKARQMALGCAAEAIAADLPAPRIQLISPATLRPELAFYRHR